VSERLCYFPFSDWLPDAPWPPECPKCGSSNGSLGTSNAYFVCGDCVTGEATYNYFCGEHPGSEWDKAIVASPYARYRDLQRIARRALEEAARE